MSSLPGCCYVCNECPCSYATLDDLENHMDMMHSGSLRKESNEEIGTTEGENHIKGHESKTTVDDAKEDVGEQDVHETESGGNSPSSSDVSNFDGAMDGLGFAMDEVTSDEGRGFSCRFCPKVFEERQQLNVHYTLTHRDKPQYECEECHTIFAVKRELSTHMRIHSGEQPHTCTQCGKEFGTRQLLKKHWMWHTGERSHVCPHCGKAFFQKGHLTQHLMIHAGGRPHQCKLCQKTFIFKFDLNRHMKIHAERGFSCDRCGRSFLKQMQLDEHVLKCKGNSGRRSQPSTRTSTPVSDGGKYDSQLCRHQQPTNQQTSVSSDDMTKMAQALVVQQHQQQRVMAAVAAAQQNAAGAQTTVANNPLLQVNALQSLARNLIAAPQQSSTIPQSYFCIFCMKSFSTQASFTLHLSFVHFRNGVLSAVPINHSDESVNHQDPPHSAPSVVNPLFYPPSSIKTGGELNGNCTLDSATNSSCASSPQKNSPTASKSDSGDGALCLEKTESNASATNLITLGNECENCAFCRQRIAELEQELAAKEIEVKNARDRLQQTNVIISFLLESCTDFGKQWMTHSRNIYSQIQSVICNME